MAEAIARSAIDQEVLAPQQIIAADPSPQRLALFDSMQITVAAENRAVINQAAHVVLAIKPQMLDSIGADLAAIDVDRQVLISIMAGITSGKLEQAIGKPARIVRIMPNTPVLVGCGMAAIALGPHARKGDDDLAMNLFGAAGQAIRVDEAQLDAVTAVSGSGPAYVFYLAEIMARAAADLGLAEQADQLVRQTVLGAATLLARSDDSAADLRRKVTSAGGTTEAALSHMAGHGVAEVIMQAIAAARERSEELGA